jgi:hypothetical protein
MTCTYGTCGGNSDEQGPCGGCCACLGGCIQEMEEQRAAKTDRKLTDLEEMARNGDQIALHQAREAEGAPRDGRRITMSGDHGASRSRDEIQEEVFELRRHDKNIDARKGATRYPAEDAMKAASITVRLAALWEEWQASEWELYK